MLIKINTMIKKLIQHLLMLDLLRNPKNLNFNSIMDNKYFQKLFQILNLSKISIKLIKDLKM